MNVTLTADDGRTYDITEHFQIMYDNLVGGMDWGSGFLDGNDALIVMQAGAAAGFEVNMGESYKSMFETSAPALKAFPHPEVDPSVKAYSQVPGYWDLMKQRHQWVKEQLGDPPTWETIAAYREQLAEMENSE